MNDQTPGFTLIEVLVVIFFIAIISAIATPNILSWRSNAKLRGAANNLKGDMERAKLKAIQENDTVVINFTENSYRVLKGDGSAIYGDRTLPAGVKIDLDKTNFDGESARFFGRATADPGSAVLVNTKGSVKKVTVSGLGKISITSDE